MAEQIRKSGNAVNGFDDTSVHEAAECLREGGVVLVPTDTVYGLAVHPERPDAADRLFAMKRRPRSRNLPIMVASPDRLDPLGVIVTDAAARLMEAFFPGPLSLALGLRTGESPEWLADRVEVAVRIPDHHGMLALLRVAGPLLVTSANIHEQETRESASSIVAALDGLPDLVIDGGTLQTVPSTLVNCNLPVPVIERPGIITREEIEKVLE
jgi:L-threonylcarbamoyladenylate synthase